MELVNYLNGLSPQTFAAGEAQSGDDLVAIAAATTSATLKAMLDDVTPTVRPISAQKGDTAPYIVYALDNARLLTAGNGAVGTIVEFDVAVFHKTASELSTMLDTVNSTLSGCSITSVSTGIDRETNYFIGLMRVEIFKPGISGSYPFALVSLDGESAAESEYNNHVDQVATRSFSITILSDSNNIETLRGTLRAALLGWQQTSYHWAMEYASGQALPLGGGVYAWQEQYQDRIVYRQT